MSGFECGVRVFRVVFGVVLRCFEWFWCGFVSVVSGFCGVVSGFVVLLWCFEWFSVCC